MATGIIMLAAILFIVTGFIRICGINKIWTSLVVPSAFLGSYYIVYNKVPSLPPVGAVNKVFYVIAAGAVVGFFYDLVCKARYPWLLPATQPIASALYIGWPRLHDGFPELAIAAALGSIAQLVLICRATDAATERDVNSAILLSIACVGFAPIALLGASSSSFQLCLTAAAAIIASLVWHLTDPRFSFGSASRLAGTGGLLAVAYPVILITGKADLRAVAVLGLIVFAPRASDALNDYFELSSAPARRSIFVLCCLAPAVAAVLLALSLYPSPFPL
ncbi:hypothetical protein JQ596_23805 [Bradyrhizobium manausense]|uniref:hypothetical protein n=1 Tax=Bradyrhizobium manausense TaxID=989370 RepID=UPI001BA7EE30|nr:hypothetical protein [Bradyrhizobium manausense]MBR0828565.1 hypothetical protein [Bradyrhizobium manausense]